MRLFILQGWRNLQRNLRRTLITIAVVSVGLTLLILSYAMLLGFLPQLVEGGARTLNGHILIQARGYQQNQLFKLMLTQPKPLLAALEKEPRIETWSTRLFARGLLSSAESVRGIKLMGVDIKQDRKMIHLYQKLVRGRLPQTTLTSARPSQRPVEILIGQKLAEQLKLNVGNKAVMRVGQWGGGATSIATKVSGIFATGSPGFDGLMVVVTQHDAAHFLRTEQRIHQIAIRVKQWEDAPAVVQSLQQRLSAHQKETDILAWTTFAPEILAMVKMTNLSIGLSILLLFPFVLLGCLNTMSMSIFERTHEIGVLQSLGVRPRQILLLFCAEATWIGLIGVMVGIILGGSASLYFEYTGGISLRWLMSQDVKMMVSGVALEPVMMVKTSWNALLIPAVSLFFATVLAALFPAWKAARLQPAQAMRSI